MYSYVVLYVGAINLFEASLEPREQPGVGGENFVIVTKNLLF